jgi:hypothetical protein
LSRAIPTIPDQSRPFQTTKLPSTPVSSRPTEHSRGTYRDQKCIFYLHSLSIFLTLYFCLSASRTARLPSARCPSVVVILCIASFAQFLTAPREPHEVVHEALLLYNPISLSISAKPFLKAPFRSTKSRGSRGEIQFQPIKPRGFTGSRGQRGIPPLSRRPVPPSYLAEIG